MDHTEGSWVHPSPALLREDEGLQTHSIYVSVNSQHLTECVLHSIQYQKAIWEILEDREMPGGVWERGQEEVLSPCLSRARAAGGDSLAAGGVLIHST